MPLAERTVQCANVAALMDNCEANLTDSRDLLQLAGVAHVAALLTEFGKLTVHANEIFTQLMQDASETFRKINLLSDKVNHVEQRIQSLNVSQLASKKFKKTAGLISLQRRTVFMFMDTQRPQSLLLRYQNDAAPMPDFRSVDQFAEDGKCAQKYSNPTFLIEQWLISEKKRQKEAEERRVRKRVGRRAKRKQENDAKKTKASNSGFRISVKAVQKKKYNKDGQEFVGAENILPDVVPQQKHHELIAEPSFISRRNSLHDSTETECISSDQLVTRFPPPPMPPAPAVLDISAHDEQPNTRAPLPTPPPLPNVSNIAIPFAPPLPSVSVSSPPPPPSPPSSPPPPPVASAVVAVAVAAAPTEMLPIVSDTNNARTALMQSIQTGTSLRPVKREPVALSPRVDLLSQIRSGKQLRAVVPSTPRSRSNSTAVVDNGPYSEIKKLLDRRQFISVDDESNEDSDYDSDEWD